ncbi:uncharacterized protein LOC112523779 [Cynara cardunculus var. scolymus]|uniref:uncharacterized protein LOC112523779 n=1 Tax=Cynara cardunculus var. scolymus TaxID=59895 RepID=UPI000D624EEF|nr:uncharacterized protein LOC112523779 [Cynara cardunculus var. scolymus]
MYTINSMFPDLFIFERNRSCFIVDRYTPNSSDGRLWNWSWLESPIINSRLSDKVTKLQNLVRNYEFSSGRDKWIWVGDSTGIFTVKSMRAVLDEKLNGNVVGQSIWCKWLPIKINCFLWRLFLRRIPTRQNLGSRGIQLQTDSCPLCGREVETEEHLFYVCEKSKEIWRWVERWCDINSGNHSSLDQIVVNLIECAKSKKQRKMIEALIGSILWFTWKARNDVMFNNKRFSWEAVMVDSQAMLFTWIKCRSKCNIDWSRWGCNPLALF